MIAAILLMSTIYTVEPEEEAEEPEDPPLDADELSELASEVELLKQPSPDARARQRIVRGRM